MYFTFRNLIKFKLVFFWLFVQTAIVAIVWACVMLYPSLVRPIEVTSESNIDRKIKQMSIEEKVGQMMIVSVLGTEPGYYATRMIRDRNIGGVCFLEVNVKSEEQTKSFIDGLQQLTKYSGQQIPLFVFVDQEGGEVSRIKDIDPYDIPQFDLKTPQELEHIAVERARKLRYLGFNVNFSPVLDNAQGRGFIGTRSFDTNATSQQVQFGLAMMKGYRQGGIISAPKHYIGHGDTTVDTHFVRTTLTQEQIVQEKEIWFSVAAQGTFDIIMVGHTSQEATPNTPNSLDKQIYQEVRQFAGNDTVLIPDEMRMLSATYEISEPEAAVLAVKSGADMILTFNLPEEQVAIYNALVAAAYRGDIAEEQIDKSVRRILNLKRRYFYSTIYDPE